MKSMVRVVVVCLGLACACSCRYLIDPDGANRLGQGDQIGLLTFVADTIEYTSYDAVAQQISAFPDARVYLRIEGGVQAAYFDAQVRVFTTDLRVSLTSFIIRFGDIDSSARFYQIRTQSAQFSYTFTMSDQGILDGTFSGLLEGTGVNAFGKTILIRKGKIKAPWKPTAHP